MLATTIPEGWSAQESSAQDVELQRVCESPKPNRTFGGRLEGVGAADVACQRRPPGSVGVLNGGGRHAGCRRAQACRALERQDQHRTKHQASGG